MAQPMSESPAFPEPQIAMTPSQSQTVSVLGISSPPGVIATPDINSLYRGYAPATMVCIKSYKCMYLAHGVCSVFYTILVIFWRVTHVFSVCFIFTFLQSRISSNGMLFGSPFGSRNSSATNLVSLQRSGQGHSMGSLASVVSPAQYRDLVRFKTEK